MSELTEATQRACMEVITYAGNARSLYIRRSRRRTAARPTAPES